jgi:hypothetical protein
MPSDKSGTRGGAVSAMHMHMVPQAWALSGTHIMWTHVVTQHNLTYIYHDTIWRQLAEA